MFKREKDKLDEIADDVKEVKSDVKEVKERQKKVEDRLIPLERQAGLYRGLRSRSR